MSRTENYHNEETISNWTRGDLHGEWTLSHDDMSGIFGPSSEWRPKCLQETELEYAGNDSMRVCMTEEDALEFNVPFRNRQEFKMRTLPWDVNLLNAFHNLHFILYMADRMPDFRTPMYKDDRPFNMSVPGLRVWIFQLIMKAASECLRDDFIKISSKGDNSYDYRVTPTTANSPGFELHIAGDCIFNLFVYFAPTVNGDGTFGCEYNVDLCCSLWNGGSLPLTGKRATDNPLRANMIAMRDYIKKELSGFSKTLAKAEFNRPENSLYKLNTVPYPGFTVEETRAIIEGEREMADAHLKMVR